VPFPSLHAHSLPPEATRPPAISLPTVPVVPLQPWSSLPGPGTRAGDGGASNVFASFPGFNAAAAVGAAVVSGFPGVPFAPLSAVPPAVGLQSAAAASGSPQPMGGEPN
jgi:hypothetical protein